jgi:hypothetical protein
LCAGKYRETCYEDLLLSANIGAVLQLAEPVSYPRIQSLFLPVDDGVPIPHPYLRQGVTFALQAKASGQHVMIACGAGISRSAAFAIATVKEAEEISLVAALHVVQSGHPAALPHPAVWESLCTYYEEEVAFEEVLRGYQM